MSKNKKTFKIFITIALLTIFPQSFAITDKECNKQFLDGTPPIITNQKLTQKLYKLCFPEVTNIYSGMLKVPLAVGVHLTKDRVIDAKEGKREDKFYAEPSLPIDERSELSDFKKSGWQRGHMEPFRDFATDEGKRQSFSLANIIPQDGDNNEQLWASIEMTVRRYAEKEGDIYVITGPIFEGKSLKLLNNRIYIPTSIYKAVYNPQKQQAGAYITKNEPGDFYEIISIKELESRIGINLFPNMPNNVKENKLSLPIPEKYSGNKNRQNSQLNNYNMIKSFVKNISY